jgi:hypothetical protein
MTVTTASASEATKVIVRTRPVVSARRLRRPQARRPALATRPHRLSLRPAAPPSLGAVRLGGCVSGAGRATCGTPGPRHRPGWPPRRARGAQCPGIRPCPRRR